MRAQGLQAASPSPGGTRRSQGKSHFIERTSCSSHEGCVGSQPATPASRFSTSSGTSPSFSFPEHEIDLAAFVLTDWLIMVVNAERSALDRCSELRQGVRAGS